MTWQCEHYPSGTTIVTRDVGGPYFYVCGPFDPDSDKRRQNRIKCCEDICGWLNRNAPRPAWLDDCERRDESAVEALDGTLISAMSPCYEVNPPSGIWQEPQNIDDMMARRVLIEVLMYRPKVQRPDVDAYLHIIMASGIGSLITQLCGWHWLSIGLVMVCASMLFCLLLATREEPLP